MGHMTSAANVMPGPCQGPRFSLRVLTYPWRRPRVSKIWKKYQESAECSAGHVITLRSRNLDAIVRQLRAAGIEVSVEPKEYPNGRFARRHDPEGNPIALWEPKRPERRP